MILLLARGVGMGASPSDAVVSTPSLPLTGAGQ